jgi:AraC-like DNA-binding protein
MVVKSELEQAGVTPVTVELGEAEIHEALSREALLLLDERLKSVGFELLDDRRSRITERVKNLILELIYSKNNELKTNLSDYIAINIGNDYNYISSLFSQQESTTIEQYYILQKIERVKELLVYDEFNLNEIAAMLNYSSPSHLTKQFKKVTGLTPSFFKELKPLKRRPLDNL